MRWRMGLRPAYCAWLSPPKLNRAAHRLRKKDTWAEKLLWSWQNSSAPDDVLRLVPPHPAPLPEGEGTARAALRVFEY